MYIITCIMWYIYEASYITCTTCSTTLHVKISKNLEYSEHCVPFFGTSQSTRNSHSLISCSIYNLESCFISILHCAPLHVHHRFAVRTAVPRGQTAVSTSANCTPRSSLILIFQDTSLPTPQLTFSILLTLTLIFLKT